VQLPARRAGAADARLAQHGLGVLGAEPLLEREELGVQRGQALGLRAHQAVVVGPVTAGRAVDLVDEAAEVA
jgi:hypothetical protein